MSRQPYHTSPAINEQLRTLNEEGWEQAVLSQLPADYEAQAYQLGAFARERELQRPAQVLRAVLAYVLCGMSFRTLACWAVLIGLPNLSDTAWRKRIRLCQAWLFWMLQELLTPSQPVVPVVAISAEIRSIKLVDATRLKELGGSGDDYRVHVAYDLATGRLAQVSLSDRHGAESFSRFVLQPNDVIVGDGGYGYRVCVVYACKRDAFAIVRICPSTFPLQDEQGNPLDVVQWLKEKKQGTHGKQVWFEYRGKRYQARLIARSLQPEDAERARAARAKKAKKKQRVLKEETLFLAGWILLISTVPQRIWSDEEVLRLYQARWQIELLFKRMKQILHLNQLRGQTIETNEVTILASLLAWVVHEHHAQQCRAVLDALYQPVEPPPLPASEETAVQEEQQAALSEWHLAAVGVHTLRVATQGYWTTSRLQLCVPHLQRFLRGSPRKRRHQRHSIQRWLWSQRKEVSDDSFDLLFSCSGT
jgi:DDE family transposase